MVEKTHSIFFLPIADWELETGNWKLETGKDGGLGVRDSQRSAEFGLGILLRNPSPEPQIPKTGETKPSEANGLKAIIVS